MFGYPLIGKKFPWQKELGTYVPYDLEVEKVREEKRYSVHVLRNPHSRNVETAGETGTSEVWVYEERLSVV